MNPVPRRGRRGRFPILIPFGWLESFPKVRFFCCRASRCGSLVNYPLCTLTSSVSLALHVILYVSRPCDLVPLSPGHFPTFSHPNSMAMGFWSICLLFLADFVCLVRWFPPKIPFPLPIAHKRFPSKNTSTLSLALLRSPLPPAVNFPQFFSSV